ncbi:DUF916 and DUF3324 domain-containing protein [Enterococcus sp. LJL90]
MSRENGRLLIKIVVSIFLMVGMSLIGGETAKATSDSSSASASGGFTYTIQVPENQVSDNQSYFNLMMTANQQQTLIVTVANPTEAAITVNLELNGSKTNRNGVIEYVNGEIENDPSLPFSFTDLVTGPTSVDLASGESQDVEINVQMPETSFEGLIMGGLRLTLAEGDGTTNSDEGAVVINRYAYVIAIALQESDISGILPEMSWNRAYAGQANFQNTIFVNFSNISGALVGGMTVQAQISQQGSGEVLYESRSTSLQMAPYSFIDYPVSMGGDAMVAGMYTAHVLVYVGDQSWEFTEDFEITVDEANQYNERDLSLTQDPGIDWKLVAMVVAGFLFVVILIFLVVRQIKKNNRKKNGSKAKKRSKKAKNKK